MNELTTSTSKLVDAITPTINKISEIFCVSVDAIKENAMEYILMYGKYHVTKEVVSDITCWFFIGLVIWTIAIVITFWSYFESDEEEKPLSYYIKWITKFMLLLTLLVMTASALHTMIPYWISPEMYSIDAFVKLAKNF